MHRVCKRNTGVFSTKVLANCAMESRTTQQKACQVPSQAAYQGICQSVGHFDARDRRASVSHFTPATSSRSSNTGCRSVFSHSEFRINQVLIRCSKDSTFPYSILKGKRQFSTRPAGGCSEDERFSSTQRIRLRVKNCVQVSQGAQKDATPLMRASNWRRRPARPQRGVDNKRGRRVSQFA